MTVRVPGMSQQQGKNFLASVHGGSVLGAGRAASVDFVGLRNSYETHAKALGAEVEQMRSAGASEAEIARKVVQERTMFARMTRLRQGPGSTVVLEVRDQIKYGLGGRSYENLSRRAERTATATVTKESRLIAGAMKPQSLMDAKYLEAAHYLKYGGPIMLVLGAGLSAKEIASSSKADRPRVIAEEAGGFVGGELASESAAIALLAVGTGGLGLVAIAGIAVVGVVGGIAGTWLADKLYYAHRAHVVQQAKMTGQVHEWSIRSFLP
jgi:hypothetical protein